jgi:hypothetical protein
MMTREEGDMPDVRKWDFFVTERDHKVSVKTSSPYVVSGKEPCKKLRITGMGLARPPTPPDEMTKQGLYLWLAGLEGEGYDTDLWSWSL